MSSPSTSKDEKRRITDKLNFIHFPAYASFILENKLEEYASEQLRCSFEENIPLLKFLSHLSEKELHELAIESNREFLEAVRDNKLKEFIDKSTRDYIKNSIMIIDREQVVAEDITTITFIRRKTLRKFLTLYSGKVEDFVSIMEEVDRFVAESEAASFNAFIQVQQEDISRINMELKNKHDDLLEAQELAEMGSFLWNISGHQQSVYTPGVMKIFEIEKAGNLDEFMAYVHKDDREMLKTELDKALQNDGFFECKYRYVRNGREKTIWSRGIVGFEDGKPVSMKGTIMDVSDRYDLLYKLQENEEHLQELINNAPDAVIVLDENYLISLWNPKSEDIFGWKSTEVIGRSLTETIIPVQFREDHKDGLVRLLKSGLPKKRNKTLELNALNKKGNEFFISITVSQYLIQGKSSFIAFIRDITDDKQTKAELQAKTRLLENLNVSLEAKNSELQRINKELESFNYIASHDLQEPLRKIQTFTQMILDKGKDKLPANVTEYFNKIMNSSARMKLLIEDLLMFSQTTANEDNFELTDMNAVLEEVRIILSAVIEEKQAVIKADKLPHLRVIPFQVQQLFLNLISNAIKYSLEHTAPKIQINSHLVLGNTIPDRNAIPEKEYYEISFRDNGIGFEEDHAEKIFGLFQRLHNKDKYSGTGIGLAICKKIVNNHNGFITAKGRPGKGSVFLVYLPAETTGSIRKMNYLVN